MSARAMIWEALAGLLDFGRVTSTKQEPTTKNVSVAVEGNTGPEAAESRSAQALWGHPAVMYRPKPDADGSFEVVFARRGEEMLPLVARETRWQIDLAEGDVVVRNVDGTNPVRLHLLADGTAVLEANTVKIGDASATEAIGLGTAIKGHLDALKTFIDEVKTVLNAHTHSGVTVGAGTTGALLVPVAGSNPSVPDVESRHKVEN